VFDPVKQRVKGTEAEAFLRKGRPQPANVRYIFMHMVLLTEACIHTAFLGYNQPRIPIF
jgi:hypothetical protein